MLSHEDNELLTRVGPGTPMGEFMREYWIPSMLSSELPHPDCPPVRVMLLGERLIAFRTSNNEVVLTSENCPHRGASFFYGHSTENGFRCAYHGMEFAADGSCSKVPCKLSGSKYKDMVRVRTYRCLEKGGLIWTYMGKRETPPSLPSFFEDEDMHIGAVLVSSNWLQNLESNIDLFHIKTLHSGYSLRVQRYHQKNTETPTFEANIGRGLSETKYEADIVAGRGVAFVGGEEIGKDKVVWGVGRYLYPFWSNLPQGDLALHWIIACVPMDDHHTLIFGVMPKEDYSDYSTLMHFGSKEPFVPNGHGWFERFRLMSNEGNDFNINRSEQRNPEGYAFGTGVFGQCVQDVAITTGMGKIVDRTKEHLTKSDIAIVTVRQALLKAVREHQEGGAAAPGVDNPFANDDCSHGSLILDKNESWRERLGIS